MSVPGSAQPDPPTKVAILGGGCGGLAAAWHLTATPALRRRFDVSVYEQSWQLGGKGASGRMAHQSAGGARGHRIHEHGLHIWFGFYQHAFRMLQGAYEESGLATGDDWWKVPFQRCDAVSLYEEQDDGTWLRQPIHLPRRGGADRGPPTEVRQLVIGRAMARMTRLLATGLRSELGGSDRRRGGSGARGPGDPVAAAASALERIADEMDRVESPVVLGTADARRSSRRGRMVAAERPRAQMSTEIFERLLEELLGSLRALRGQVEAATTGDRLRLWRGVLELVASTLTGIVRDDVLWRGFGALDEEDFREWLSRHGANEQTLTRSPVLRALYDLTFAYREGDKRRPSLAAGKGLQSLLMMINYEGSFMWRMRAGMGDVVFAPVYLALKQRGVNFHFFSRVSRLRLMPGRPVIDGIELTRRATVREGSYDPLERIGDWWCWPAEPDLTQLDGLAPSAETLHRGVDFDDVVLAIPVGALPELCGELAGANPRFKLMLDRAATVRTKCLQLWLTKPIDELRGPLGGDGLDPPATAYAEPFDTYCDMSHLLEPEGYPSGQGPKGVAYFCAVLPDAAHAGEATGGVRTAAADYLERAAGTIWPGALKEGTFDWSVLFDPQGRTGRDRLDAQYFRANIAATDRYVTTPAGSVDARLDPDQSGFENLVLAGDWTHNEIDGGCVEAAVISGERAADALRGRRRLTAVADYTRTRYVEYGALATAPGPLVCERARLFCFILQSDRARVQHLCDRVFKEPTGGALRYLMPRLSPVILTFGTIAGLRSLHPDHANRGSASEPEAAIWVPTIAQHYHQGRFTDEHLAIFMPYLWVDDPIAFASGREVYGFAKTQGWMPRLDDPRGRTDARIPDPPESLMLDVYGTPEYGQTAELVRHRLITIRRRSPRRDGSGGVGPDSLAEGTDLSSLVGHVMAELEPSWDPDGIESPRRSLESVRRPFGTAKARAATLGELLSQQVVRHVFLKQFRDAANGELAVLQQVVEARSSVSPGSLRWRRLRGSYELAINQLASHPLGDELGLAAKQTVRLAFAAEFGFRMEPGVVRWPRP